MTARLLIPALVAFALPWVLALVLRIRVGVSPNLGEEWSVLLFNGVWTSWPLVAWAVLARSRAPLAAGLLVALLAWGYAGWDAVRYHIGGEGGGANIGLGLMLLALPALMLAVMAATHAMARARGSI